MRGEKFFCHDLITLSKRENRFCSCRGCSYCYCCCRCHNRLYGALRVSGHSSKPRTRSSSCSSPISRVHFSPLTFRTIQRCVVCWGRTHCCWYLITDIFRGSWSGFLDMVFCKLPARVSWIHHGTVEALPPLGWSQAETEQGRGMAGPFLQEGDSEMCCVGSETPHQLGKALLEWTEV